MSLLLLFSGRRAGLRTFDICDTGVIALMADRETVSLVPDRYTDALTGVRTTDDLTGERFVKKLGPTRTTTEHCE